MEEKKKSSKRWIIYIVIALVIPAGVCLYLLWGLKDYMDKVPDITPKASLQVTTGQELTAEDIFDIQCKGSYVTKLNIEETDIADAVVSADRQTLYVGSVPGSIRVYVVATGEVAESTDSENTIVVTMK